MRLTAEERILYARAVWATFQTLAGTRRDMSSAEYHIVAGWMDRQLPLPVVLRGLTEFTGKPRRLEAVVGSVDRSAEYWQQAMGGL